MFSPFSQKNDLFCFFDFSVRQRRFRLSAVEAGKASVCFYCKSTVEQARKGAGVLGFSYKKSKIT